MPFTAIPVFPRRLFSLSQMWVNSSAGIHSPRDLIGKKVGLSTFQTTLSVLAKGDLQSEYEVHWREIDWYISKDEAIPLKPIEGVKMQLLDSGQKIGAMLENGEIDALMMPHPPKEALRGGGNIRRLFPDPKTEESKYFRKNGYYPIMHVVAFKDEVLAKDASLARSIMAAFDRAKEICIEYYDDPNWSRFVWGRHLFEEERAAFGADPWPHGIGKTAPIWNASSVTPRPRTDREKTRSGRAVCREHAGFVNMPLNVKCPTCRNETEWENNPHRPFCSDRCQLIDLGAWTDEKYRIPRRIWSLTMMMMRTIEKRSPEIVSKPHDHSSDRNH